MDEGEMQDADAPEKPEKRSAQKARALDPSEGNEEELTCQLVSPGRPVICIRYAVRLGRGCVRSGAGKSR